MKRSEAIKNLLVSRTLSDLAALYNADMEVQINVAADGGERTDGDYKGRIWHGWTDGTTTWKPFRIPLNAKTEPEPNDYDINFDLAAHAEGIGMTGWDWKNKVSRWVAYDFDAIVGHSDKHAKKLQDTELIRIRELVTAIPWITIRHSTGGKGLHLYVFLDPAPTTINHCEHAAVARSILGMLASLTSFDFQSKVDVCGGNMWVWHRKMVSTQNGLSLIREGTSLAEIPANWRDHIGVVTKKNRKTVPAFIQEQSQADEVERLFDELTGQKTRTTLDEEHQKLIQFLHEIHANSWWDQDNHMLVTHTKFLERAHNELGLKGIFKTTSPGTEIQEQNCFLFPLRKGGWVVRRYTPGVAEAETWDQDGNGWTRCFLNQKPDLATAAKSFTGIEHKSGGFVFREAEMAVKAAQAVGINVELPSFIMSRKAKLTEQKKDGRLLFEVLYESSDSPEKMNGWLNEKKSWTKIFGRIDSNSTEPDTGNYDDMIRHMITEANEDCGWLLKSSKHWRGEPLVHIRTFLASLGLGQQEVNSVLGSCIANPWRLVCRPFQPEILGDRDWNRNAPQFACAPNNTDVLTYPTWLSILEHCGAGLNDAILDNPWAKANGIFTGADYLKCWIASLFKEPMEPLPYLFFYGPQNSGKSIFHEALTLLVTRGVERADKALTSQQGFNGELENAILCVVEETDMRKDKTAYSRIKDWVTSRLLPVHKKMMTPYSVPNTTHWVQCANEHQACPVLPGDSRITMIYVDSLDVTKMIPKKSFIPMLEKEAPDFLASILNLELPPSDDRLNIPVIETGDKKFAVEANRTLLEIFIETYCHYVPGEIIIFKDFDEKFKEWLPPDQVAEWGKIRLGREIPIKFPKGRSKQFSNQVVIGNMAWEPKEPKRNKMILTNGYVVPSVNLEGAQ